MTTIYRRSDDLSWFNRSCDPDMLRECAAVQGTMRETLDEPIMSFALSPADVLQLQRMNEAHELMLQRDRMREAHTQAVPEPLRTMAGEAAQRRAVPRRWWQIVLATAATAFSVPALGIAGIFVAAILGVRAVWRWI